jgi:arginine/lysine/ornithine decarboxylase
VEITPLWDALRAVALASGTGFHTPGHNGGAGLPPALKHWPDWGRLDLTELAGLDNLHAPTGVIAHAQALAAAAWEAERSWFLVNGATAGIQAMLLAALGEGQKVLVPRNCHRSIVHALVLSGAVPVFVEPVWDGYWQLAHGLTAATVEAALAAHPDLRAVVAVHPTYFGAVGETRAIARVAHAKGIALLVDAAHGAHLRFHPDLPECALAAGADLVVHSAHKTLPALTQAALLHQQGTFVDPARVETALQLVQTTSPSYLLMASLDLARAYMVRHGRERLGHILEMAHRLRHQLPFTVLGGDGTSDFDPTRLVIDVGEKGWSGHAAETWLEQNAQVRAEMATHRHLVFILNGAHTEIDGEQLQTALLALATAQPTGATPLALLPPPLPELHYSPREAFGRSHRSVPLHSAAGLTSAADVCTYPPGVPVLLPGEVVAAQSVEYLRAAIAAGAETLGIDPRGHIRVAID